MIQDPANAGVRPDAIAYTQGPGLTGALLVGASVGESLALAWDIPAIGVHHMEGHLLAPMLEDPAPEPPFVALLVSGGHTMLVDVAAIGAYNTLGQTLDDAAGEAFDKTAKLLGLPYPGGPAIARAALRGTPQRFHFPRPMTNRPGLDFSFSGLKTFALTTARENQLDTQTIADIAHAFQEAVTDTLLIKCRRALKQTGHKRLIVAGGVGANRLLREKISALVENESAQAILSKNRVLYRQWRHDCLCRLLPLASANGGPRWPWQARLEFHRPRALASRCITAHPPEPSDSLGGPLAPVDRSSAPSIATI